MVPKVKHFVPRSLLLLVLLFTLAVVVSACGEDKKEFTGDEKKAVDVVNQYLAAVKNDDIVKSQCKLTTEGYIHKFTASSSVTREQCVEILGKSKSKNLPALPKGLEVEDVKLSGKTADVTVAAEGYRDASFTLKKEGNSFKVDDFEDQ